MYFGKYVNKLRLDKRITLREFSRRAEVDSSNWSKIERGVINPPKCREILDRVADVLELKVGTSDYSALYDLAAIGSIPENLIDDNSLLKQLPVFFRTNRGEKPTEEELDGLLDLIKSAWKK